LVKKTGGKYTMKKILMIALIAVLAVGLIACTSSTPAESSEAASSEAASSEAATEAATESASAEAEVLTLDIGMYADGADSYYQVLHDTLQACADEDPTCDWTVNYKVGQNTAAEQLQAVEDFITSGYDAIVVIQNSVDTTSECITKCVDAGIPYFGATHSFVSAPNASDAAGSVCYNFVEEGYTPGALGYERGASKLIMIEGQLGQGTASAQTEGYLQAYEDAGANMGGVTAVELATEKDGATQDGTQDITVVGWASGGWFADPAQKAMTDFITSLGADGFDSVYAQNDPMMEGVLAAIEDAGLNPSDYYLSAGNGREISWQWVKDGTIQADVNQSAALEGDAVYQQIKAYFNGEDYRKYIHPYLTPYNTDNINELWDSLVPFSDVTAYMEGRAAGNFITDINDPAFTDIDGF
jgi:ABC-type sugar transport system substrate-binding protein